MTIEEVTGAFSFQEILALMHQLNPELKVTEEMVGAVVDSPDSHLYIMLDGQRIIGTATLGIYFSPTGRKASIEDVVVLEEYRGQHLGRELVQHLLDQALKFAPIQVHLTSRPSREAANRLYQSLGFIRKDTNCYIYSIM